MSDKNKKKIAKEKGLPEDASWDEINKISANETRKKIARKKKGYNKTLDCLKYSCPNIPYHQPARAARRQKNDLSTFYFPNFFLDSLFT
jgi:hypothetical protein